jgi:ubiquinone/menaquinone biosynthesis C-methylase UbiE
VTTAQPAGGDPEPPGSRPQDSVAFDRAAGFYDESRGLDPAVEELVADRVEEAVGPEGRLLEIGVGTGRIALPLHRRGRDYDGAVDARIESVGAADGMDVAVKGRADDGAIARDHR